MTLFDTIALSLKLVFVLGITLNAVPVMVWFERRGSAWIQGRVGPNRVGPFGLLQPVADVLKFVFKEDFVPAAASKFYYHVAPAIAAIAPMAAFAAIPFGSFLVVNGQQVPLQIATLDVGVLSVLAFAGLEVYPIMLAGWASNNKYAIFGALRGSSQMVSYEIALGLSLVSVLLIYGTLDLNAIVQYQEHEWFGFIPRWGMFMNPIAFVIFLIAIFAETNRLPFDLPEGDAELVAGYHVEYGATKFAMFFFAEYVAMIMASSVLVTLFAGGYGLLPGLGLLSHGIGQLLGFGPDGIQNLVAVAQAASFIFKVACVMFFFVWVRWTLPRFRFDQLMNLGWKILFPIALANLLFVAIVIALVGCDMATKIVTRKEGFWDKYYLPALAIGLKVTIKQFYKTLFRGQSTTIQYPEVKRNYSQRFRGMHFISIDENKVENCTSCYLCQTVCPAECITIVAEERPDDQNPYGVRKEKRPLSFDIDALRCCFCGMCEEACPKDAIKLSRNYELATTSRDEAFYDLDHLKREIKGRG